MSFKLLKGMYLVITRTLDFETPTIVAYAFSYKQVWDYWVSNPHREWDLALVRVYNAESPEGKREVLQVWKINKPIPPSRYAARLVRKKPKRA